MGHDLRAYGHQQQLGGTRLVTLEDGSERGVRVVEFRTASGLELGVLVDRAFDVGWFRHEGRSVAWHSPTGFVGPWYREVDGLGPLRSFSGGLWVTSGLDHILFPQHDPHDTYGYPAREGTDYGLHGRVASTPAKLVSYGERWEGDRCVLFAEGEVTQAGALAEHLVLRRRIELDLDGLTLRWTDQVTNRGWQTTPHMLLYHMNLGAPLIGPDTTLHAPTRKISFRTETASGDEDEHLRFPPPDPGFVEQAFAHEMEPDAEGSVSVFVRNGADPDRPWGVRLRYSSREFPHFFQWRYLAAGTYVLGIEPATNGLGGRAEAREKGELIMLEQGESRSYATELEVVVGTEACERAAVASEARS